MSQVIPTSEQLHMFVDNLEEALGYDVGFRVQCRNIVLCGMGGSAISGDIVCGCYQGISRLPIAVNKSPDLPAWVDGDSFVIISSYSGNTLETVEMYKQALARGAKMVVMTSGGILAEKAAEDGVFVKMLPDDMHPRHAIGYMIGYTAAFVRAAGCSDISYKIRSAIPGLRDYRDFLEGNPSYTRGLAEKFMSTIPVIMSDSALAPVAFRWKTQFNENSKYVAFNGSTSEFKYGGFLPWVRTSGLPFTLAILSGGGASGEDAALIESMESLDASGTDYLVIGLGGTEPMEDVFRAIMLGDRISLEMAEIRGIDAGAVPPIRRLKDKLLDMPGNTDGAA